jgi:hypothetical protein
MWKAALRGPRRIVREESKTVFLDFRTDPTENVFPMVLAVASPKCCWALTTCDAKMPVLNEIGIQLSKLSACSYIFIASFLTNLLSAEPGTYRCQGRAAKRGISHETHHCRAARKRAGALSRVGLFSARGYNIESLTVAPTEDPSLSRMTILTTGSDDVIEQITKHLNRLIEW